MSKPASEGMATVPIHPQTPVLGVRARPRPVPLRRGQPCHPTPRGQRLRWAAGLQHPSGREAGGEEGPEATRQRREELRLPDTAAVGMLLLPHRDQPGAPGVPQHPEPPPGPGLCHRAAPGAPAEPVPARPASSPGPEQPWEECARPARWATLVIPGATGLARSTPSHDPPWGSPGPTGGSKRGADVAGEAR